LYHFPLFLSTDAIGTHAPKNRSASADISQKYCDALDFFEKLRYNELN